MAKEYLIKISYDDGTHPSYANRSFSTGNIETAWENAFRTCKEVNVELKKRIPSADLSGYIPMCRMEILTRELTSKRVWSRK